MLIVQDTGAVMVLDDIAVIVGKDTGFHKDIVGGFRKVQGIHPVAAIWGLFFLVLGSRGIT